MRDLSTRRARWFFLLAGTCLLLLCSMFVAAAQDSPGIRVPALSEDEKKIYNKGGMVINYGNAGQGYVMIKYKESKKVLKLRISLGKKTYTYDLNKQGEFEVFPLQMGDGKYKIQLFQEAKNGMYATLASKTITVALDDPNIPYLYPSQYVNYTADSDAVAKSFELCEGLSTDKEKIKAIYAFCARKISYHYARARSDKTGYLPDIDGVLHDMMGICFDYSAVMACMLRVQGIPTQLVIGNADKTYHAWNNVLLDGKWYRYDATFAATGNQAQNYIEERHY